MAYASAVEGSEGSEVGLVKYQTNILGTRGPRKMTVMIPKLDSKGSGAVMAGHEGGMTQRYDKLTFHQPGRDRLLE